MTSDEELYRRSVATLLASFEVYATADEEAAVLRLPGVSAAVFPSGAEASVYNNALIEPGLAGADRIVAVDVVEDVYRSAGVEHFAAWVEEQDLGLRAELERRGYRLDTTTLSMGLELQDTVDFTGLADLPAVELVALPWVEYLDVFGYPAGLLEAADRSSIAVLAGLADGVPATSAWTLDHDGDRGLFNVETLEPFRRRGLGTAITAMALRTAVRDGCTSASLQSTPMAERVYAAVGFRPLVRIIEYVPGPG